MSPMQPTTDAVETELDTGRESNSHNSSDTDVMRAEIESTRMRMSDTLDEIGDRLNPQTIKENVKDSIREATIGRVSHMARNATESVQRGTSGITNAVRENPIPAAMIALGIGWMFFNSTSERTERGAQQVASGVKDKAGELTDSVKARARSIASSVSDTSRRGQGRIEEAYSANPLALGAVAIAAGLAVGLSAPVTDREFRIMGGESPTFV
ncbi:DUF3618 domain-containing protein [Gemmatimonas groenlandica]|uniref:DUF3618 domain-containing protein n=1 Tax=Gemmatimonas groenlandica TaxID=2732249 RepID=A0A6M4IKV7_9BACT|nr:DUF3618 domain-containing protein [Gemmatimonas groenlandica]QJR34157.1 DUF3618 domain-containing protein [Gemmatimonas groenlandica]